VLVLKVLALVRIIGSSYCTLSTSIPLSLYRSIKFGSFTKCDAPTEITLGLSNGSERVTNLLGLPSNTLYSSGASTRWKCFLLWTQICLIFSASPARYASSSSSGSKFPPAFVYNAMFWFPSEGVSSSLIGAREI